MTQGFCIYTAGGDFKCKQGQHYNKESLATQNVLVAYKSEHNALSQIHDIKKTAIGS